MPSCLSNKGMPRDQGDLSLHFVIPFWFIYLFIYFYYAHPTFSPSSLFSVAAGSCLSFI